MLTSKSSGHTGTRGRTVQIKVIAASIAVGGAGLVMGPATMASATAQKLPAAAFGPQVLTPIAGLNATGCPTGALDDWAILTFSSGNGVAHDSTNKNGDWGGSTVEGVGTITFYTIPPENPDDPNSPPTNQDPNFGPFTGHVTEWGGGGNNSNGQFEGGFTFTFHGTSANGGTLDAHLNMHQTQSAANGGTPTANQSNSYITCA